MTATTVSRTVQILSLFGAAMPWLVLPFAFSMDISTGTVLATLAVTIISSLTTAIITVINAIRGGRERDAIRQTQQQVLAKAESIDVKAIVAATNAVAAARKAEELHNMTQDISDRSKEIAAQTDGQLSRVLEENKALRDLFVKVLGIMSARQGQFAGIRAEDLPAGTDGPMLLRADTGDRRRVEDKNGKNGGGK